MENVDTEPKLKIKVELDKKVLLGERVITINYKSSTIGPIYAKDEDEVKAIIELTKSKMEERKYRDLHGGSASGVYATVAVSFYIYIVKIQSNRQFWSDLDSFII